MSGSEIMEYFKSLNWYKKVLMIFLIILLSPIILFVGLISLLIFFIVIVIPSPFEKRKYKRSAYYKNLKRKYNYLLTKSDNYLLYNHLYELDENLGINLDFTDDRVLLGDKFCFIWFYYDEIWLDKKTNKWMTAINEGTREKELELFKEELKLELSVDALTKEIYFLVQEDIFSYKEYQEVLEDKSFIIYKDVDDLAKKIIDIHNI